MRLPFTHEQFLDVFGVYNGLFLPAVVLLWSGTLAALVSWRRGGAAASRMLAALLALHWGWSGIAYHLVLFRAINPAAVLFAVLFVAEAMLFVWRGVVRRRLAFSGPTTGRGAVGAALVVCALLYPLAALLSGLSYPRMPTFGVPCPTTLLTTGLLLTVDGKEARLVAVIPMLWSAIGGSAAFTLAILPDYVLPIAGALLLLHVLRPAPKSLALVLPLLSLVSCTPPKPTRERQRAEGPAAETGIASPVVRVGSQQLIPGSLSMDVFRVTVEDISGPVESAMFVSRGMAHVGQKEIALGVKLRPGEALDALQEEVGGHFVGFYGLAREGHRVEAGGRTILARESKPLLGRPDFLGIVYTVPDALTRELVGESGILAVVVTGREIEIADAVGHTRLLSQLGQRSRFFPTPFWSDRAREEVLTDESRSKSLLDGVSRVPAYGATAWTTLSGESRAVQGPTTMPDFERSPHVMKVELVIGRRSGELVRKAFASVPDSMALAMLTGLSAEMPRCLTWAPGNEEVVMISDFDRRDDLRCAANFVLFVPGQRQSEVRVMEDGLALLLRTQDWHAIRTDLAGGLKAQVRDSSGRLILDASWGR